MLDTIISFTPDEFTARLMFKDEKGRHYKILEQTKLLGRDVLFVAYLGECRNGYIDERQALSHRFKGAHNGLRKVV